MPIGLDPIAAYAYHVEVDQLVIGQFKQVSGLAVNISVIEHRENKLSAMPVLKKLPGLVDYEDLVLRRGKITDPAFWTWIKQVQDGDIDAARRSGSIVLFDYKHGEVARFNFEMGWPRRVEVSDLRADGNEVLVETVTIVHEKLTIG